MKWTVIWHSNSAHQSPPQVFRPAFLANWLVWAQNALTWALNLQSIHRVCHVCSQLLVTCDNNKQSTAPSAHGTRQEAFMDCKCRAFGDGITASHVPPTELPHARWFQQPNEQLPIPHDWAWEWRSCTVYVVRLKSYRFSIGAGRTSGLLLSGPGWWGWNLLTAGVAAQPMFENLGQQHGWLGISKE